MNRAIRWESTMNTPLDGKVAIVTGAGSRIGFGRSMTLALVEAGARVAMMDIDPETLDQTANEVTEATGGGKVVQIVGDVANAVDAERALKTTIDELGGLHILVNNAGTNPRNAGPNILFLFRVNGMTLRTTSASSAHPARGAASGCPGECLLE